MSERFTDKKYLRGDQYSTSDKLAARIRLHANYGTEERSVFDKFWDLAHEFAPLDAVVLGVGSGRGDLWKHNAEQLPEQWQITLTDFSGGMLRDNQDYVGDLASKLGYAVVDVQNVPFPDGHFDMIFANYMLYHVPDIEQAMRELRRVLKPDGALFAMTNGASHMTEMYKLAHSVDETIEPERLYMRKFSVQNGAERLQTAFGSVAYHSFDSDLVVPEPQPIIDYIASMMSIPGELFVNGNEKETYLRQLLAQRIADGGAIRISKETGLFIARGYKG